MKAELENVKIEMSLSDAKSLKDQLLGMINEIGQSSEHLRGFFDEAALRQSYPKVNEFLSVLNVRDVLPF